MRRFLKKVVSDDAPGEAAAVLREVARLHQENRTLKKRNMRVWSLALLMGVFRRRRKRCDLSVSKY